MEYYSVIKNKRKGCMLYDFKYMTFWKKQHYRDGNKVSGYEGFGEKGRVK